MNLKCTKTVLVLLAFIFSFSGCVTIAPEAVTLQKSICTEGARMHAINVLLLKNILNDKKSKIDEFVENDYKPAFISKLKSSAEEKGKKPAENIVEFTSAVETEVAKQRAKLYESLDGVYTRSLEKLNKDFEVYKSACAANERYLNSLVKVDKERKALLQQLTSYTGSSFDIDDVSKQLDKIITGGGNSEEIIRQLESLLK